MEPEPGYGAVVLGVAVGEDAAIGRVEPIAAVVRCRHYADDRALQVQAPGGSVELGRAEAEDAAVRADQPIAPLARRMESVNEAGLPEAPPAVAMTLSLSSTMLIGVKLTVPLGLTVMLLNVTEPKSGRVGCWGEPTTVGSSSIHSAESPGPA